LKFEKVSFEEFKKYFNNVKEEDMKQIYDVLPKPRRATKGSAGYDFHLPINLELKPNQSIIIPTGIKIYLDLDKKLSIYPRSGLGFKYFVRIANTVGIIDSDYVDNPKNEGHIMIKIRNEGEEIMNLNLLDRFCQGCIEKYYLVDDDETYKERTGGIGHTDQKE
jgi:dUTP pyrophosphatase